MEAIRLYPGIRSWAKWCRQSPPAWRLDSGLESPGWDIRAVFATSAAAVRKIFVTLRSLPAINARADMRNTWPRMPGFAFPYPLNIPTCRLHPCCARG